jgi:hypothetical protein
MLGWATLMTELAERGLLEDTTIIWLGEFGRSTFPLSVCNVALCADHGARYGCVTMR